MQYLYLALGLFALGMQALLYFALVAFSPTGENVKHSSIQFINFFSTLSRFSASLRVYS